MPTYVLRQLDADTWQPFSARARRDGWSLKQLFKQLIADYGAGRITPTAPPPYLPEQVAPR